MNYDENYHKKVHKLLISDNRFYQLKSKVGLTKYFSKLKKLKYKKILEYGCGLGQNIFLLKDYNVTGYDLSEFALNFCEKKRNKYSKG